MLSGNEAVPDDSAKRDRVSIIPKLSGVTVVECATISESCASKTDSELGKCGNVLQQDPEWVDRCVGLQGAYFRGVLGIGVCVSVYT